MWTRVIMTAVVLFLDGHVQVIFQHVLTGECLMWTHALVTVIVPLLGGHVQVIYQHILSMGMFDVNLEIDNDGRLRTKCYDKREDFNFPFMQIQIKIQIFHCQSWRPILSRIIKWITYIWFHIDWFDWFYNKERRTI